MKKYISNLIKKSIGFYINILSYINPKKATRLAYKFFSEPREGRLLKDSLPAVLQDADAEMITYNDAIFQVYTWPGNETKVLLVHGWESNTSRWEDFMPYLRKSGCTIIAIDAPGHGLSSGNEFNIPRYGEFISVVADKVKPQYLIGHSLGGATALYYQSHHPDNSIEKLVILGAPCDLSTIVTNYIGMLGLNDRVFRLMEKHFADNFKIKTKEFSGSLFASRIKIKGLLAHDEDDTIVSFKEGQKIAAAWPDAEFIVTKGLGHSMHDDRLYSRISAFLFEE
ncbi:MAG: alpha/beta hydrolase [Flavobacterium sp.]|nr:MAG: alpha/beta hydrolase [Flavobacterium sp.]